MLCMAVVFAAPCTFDELNTAVELVIAKSDMNVQCTKAYGLKKFSDCKRNCLLAKTAYMNAPKCELDNGKQVHSERIDVYSKYYESCDQGISFMKNTSNTGNTSNARKSIEFTLVLLVSVVAAMMI